MVLLFLSLAPVALSVGNSTPHAKVRGTCSHQYLRIEHIRSPSALLWQLNAVSWSPFIFLGPNQHDQGLIQTRTFLFSNFLKTCLQLGIHFHPGFSRSCSYQYNLLLALIAPSSSSLQHSSNSTPFCCNFNPVRPSMFPLPLLISY